MERETRRGKEMERERERASECHKASETERESECERENLNSKTLFYKDCSLGSAKNLSNS